MWFYDLHADGYSLDDKRTPLLDADEARRYRRFSPTTSTPRTTSPTPSPAGVHRDSSELDRPRTDQSFCVPKADIAANGYDLSINRYKELVHDEIDVPAPSEILDELIQLEEEIQKDIDDLKAMLR